MGLKVAKEYISRVYFTSPYKNAFQDFRYGQNFKLSSILIINQYKELELNSLLELE